MLNRGKTFHLEKRVPYWLCRTSTVYFIVPLYYQNIVSTLFCICWKWEWTAVQSYVTQPSMFVNNPLRHSLFQTKENNCLYFVIQNKCVVFWNVSVVCGNACICCLKRGWQVDMGNSPRVLSPVTSSNQILWYDQM